jgi:plasminogen activator inhibitor 1 RNA-binding protein
VPRLVDSSRWKLCGWELDILTMVPRLANLQKEKAAAAKKEKERKEKVFLEVEGKFAPPSRGEGREGAAGRGGRGGRGGFRGDRGGSDRPRGGAPRGGRGGARNNASSAPVAVNDESAFPALGA